jgi:2,3,4,5-tetrahydropyridine-2-carboxylate N-succinyltransferase
MDVRQARGIIEAQWPLRGNLSPSNAPSELAQALKWLIGALEEGTVRVASPSGGQWVTAGWVQAGILLYFKIQNPRSWGSDEQYWHDKVPLQSRQSPHYWEERSCRVAPPATVRAGAHIGAHSVLMPCYVNIGAYIGESCLIDTWATIGSGAQVGNRVHVSGGAGIGGVLEPLQAQPVIVEDDCFIGARCEVAEGVHLGRGAVLAMGVFLGSSTRIVDRETSQVFYGSVPEQAVVVPGVSLPDNQSSVALQCAVIVKRVDSATRNKVGINSILRDLR